MCVCNLDVELTIIIANATVWQDNYLFPRSFEHKMMIYGLVGGVLLQNKYLWKKKKKDNIQNHDRRDWTTI